MSSLTYITGNPEKAASFSRYSGLKVRHVKVDLEEIQTLDHRELVQHKARQAYSEVGSPVLVEDVFLTFDAWGSLPGPFVKYFVEAKEGVENMCRMLDGFANRRAVASCVFGIYDGERTFVLKGEQAGKIAYEPRGVGGYGFDRIFIPDGFGGKTAAEVSPQEYERYYTNIKPFKLVREHCIKHGFGDIVS
jgi:non-canonical purine NTP pyrophosphatase (RdgB/HAM1 family)